MTIHKATTQRASRDNLPTDRIVIGCLVVLLALGYEYTLYRLVYPASNAMALLAFCVWAILTRRSAYPESTRVLALFSMACAYAFGATFIRIVSGQSDEGFFDFLRPLTQFIFLIIVVFTFTKSRIKLFIQMISYFSVLLSVINILLFIVPGFLPWQLVSERGASIFFDPNYCGTFLGIGILYFLSKQNSTRQERWIAIPLILCGLFLTFSKGTAISLLIALLYLFSQKHGWAIKTVLFGVTIVLLLFANDIIDWIGTEFPLFRIYSLMSDRDVIFADAIRIILENPFIGYGINGVQILNETTLSAHNYFLEYAILYGIPYLAPILILLVMSFWFSAENVLNRVLLIYLILNSNSIVFSIGSVGILGVLFTLSVVSPFAAGRRVIKDPSSLAAIPRKFA